MKESELYTVREIKFDNPLLTEIDFILDRCFKDCHIVYFHIFKNEFIFDIKVTNITNNEIFILTISVKSMNFVDLNENLTNAGRIGFVFNQKSKLIKKVIQINDDKQVII